MSLEKLLLGKVTKENFSKQKFVRSALEPDRLAFAN